MTAQNADIASAADAALKKSVATAAESGTEYVILSLTNSEGYKLLAKSTARTPAAAIQAAITEHIPASDPNGTYVAIPSRSWKPIKITQQTVTTLKLEEAK